MRKTALDAYQQGVRDARKQLAELVLAVAEHHVREGTTEQIAPRLREVFGAAIPAPEA